MFSNVIFAAVLFILSGSLMTHHRWAWLASLQTAPPAEIEFNRRRFRRRLMTSGLIGLVAVAIFVGGFIEPTTAVIFYWLGVAVMVVWIGLLAFADWAVSYSHFQRIHKRQLAEHATLHAQLTAELKRLRQAGGEAPTENQES